MTKKPRNIEEEYKNINSKIYEIFEKYPPPNLREFNYCDCCCTPDEALKYIKAPKDTPFVDLDYYLGSAIYTVGELNDFKRLTPRILEKFYTTEYDDELQIYFNKIKYSDKKNWSNEELDILFQWILLVFKRKLLIDVQSIEEGFIDLLECLEFFDDSKTETLLNYFIEHLETHYDSFKYFIEEFYPHYCVRFFWSKTSPEKIYHWILKYEDKITNILINLLDKNIPEEEKDKISEIEMQFSFLVKNLKILI